MFSFDYYNRAEYPTMILKEISETPIGVINFSNISLEINWITVSKITFDINKVNNYYYDKVEELKIVDFGDFGEFQIHQIQEKTDGVSSVKSIVMDSIESMLVGKKISELDGYFYLYNPLQKDKSLLHQIKNLMPRYELEYIDSSVMSKFRYIKKSKIDVYSFLTKDCSTIYECFLIFNNKTRKYSIYDIQNKQRDSNIYIGHENLAKTIVAKKKVDKIITCLNVYGGDGLTINGVNPSGSNMIFNVDYFIPRFSESLKIAHKKYKDLVKQYKPTYDSYFVTLKQEFELLQKLQANGDQYTVQFTKNKDGTLIITPSITSSSGYSELTSLYNQLEGVRSARIQQGNIPYTDVNTVIDTVNNYINQKKSLISSKNNVIENLRKQIKDITEILKYENNFTDSEWKELSDYFIMDDLKAESFIWTDLMTQSEKQQMQQELLQFAENHLSTICYPSVDFELESINFLMSKEFEKISNKFELGSNFYLGLEEGITVKPILMGFKIDDNQNFSLIYSSDTTVNTGFDLYKIKEAINNSFTMSFDMLALNTLKEQESDIGKFLNESFDLTLKDMTTDIENVRPELLINETGVRLREYDRDSGVLTKYEAWLTGKQFVLSDDNMKSVKTAIGLITLPDGTKAYGINSGILMGNLVISKALHISNTNNSFIVDESGATLKDANFTITKGTTKITLSPQEGISIVRNSEKMFYVDSSGNLQVKGNIFGGSININNRFAVDPNGFMTAYSAELYGGIIKIGNTTITESMIQSMQARFSNAYLDSSCTYDGVVNGGQIKANSITANQIQANSITGDKIAANSITSVNIKALSITAEKIATGSITADKIAANALMTNKIMGLYDSTNVLQVGDGSYADLTWSKGSNTILKITQWGSRDFIMSSGSCTVLTVQNGLVVPQSRWDFQNCTVTGLNVTAKFA